MKPVRQLTVVALLALSAVASHMAETAAGVASLLAPTVAVAAITAALVAAGLGAVAGDVPDLTALVAFLATAGATVVIAGGSLGALAGDVTDTTAAVARLLLRRGSAFAACEVRLHVSKYRDSIIQLGKPGQLTDVSLALNMGKSDH